MEPTYLYLVTITYPVAAVHLVFEQFPTMESLKQALIEEQNEYPLEAIYTQINADLSDTTSRDYGFIKESLEGKNEAKYIYIPADKYTISITKTKKH